MAGKSAPQGKGYIFHVGLDDQGMRQTLSGLKASLKSTTAEWKSQFAIMRSQGDYLGAAKAKFEGLSHAIEQQRSLVSRYKSELTGMGSRTEKNAESYDKLSKNLHNAETRLASLSTQQEKAGKLSDYEASGIRKIKSEMQLQTREMTASVHAYMSQGKEMEANKAKADGLRKQIQLLTQQQEKEHDLLDKIGKTSGTSSSSYRNQAVRIKELEARTNEARSSLNKLSESMSKPHRLNLSSVTSGLGKVREQASKTQHIFGKMFGASLLSSAASGAFVAVTAKIHEMASAGLEYNKQQQVMNSTWDTLTNSASKGAAMVKSVNDMSTAFGQSADLVNELDQQFYHVFDNQPRTEKLTKAVLTLGDTLGMSSDDLQRLGLNFTHMLSSGRMQLGDFNMITDQLPMFGSQLLKYEQKVQHNSNLTMATLRKEMSAGKISAHDAEMVMENLGNKYSKASENMMKTLPGMERVIAARTPALIGAFEKPFQKAQSGLFEGMSKWVSSGKTEKEFNKMGAAASKGMMTIINAFSKVFGHGKVADTADSAVNGITKGITRLSNYIAAHAKDIVKFFNGAKDAGSTAFKVLVPAVMDAYNIMKPFLKLIQEHPKAFAALATSQIVANKGISLLSLGFGGAGRAARAATKVFKSFRNEGAAGNRFAKQFGHIISGISKDIAHVGGKTIKFTAKVATGAAKKSISGLGKAGKGIGKFFKWTGKVSVSAARKAISGIGKAAKATGRAVKTMSSALVRAGKWTGGKVVTGIKGLGRAAKSAARYSVRLTKSMLTKGKAIAIAAGQKIITGATKAWTVAQRALNVVLRRNPIGLIITAVAALAAGLTALYKHNKKFRNFVNSIGKTIRSFFGGLPKWFSKRWSSIKKGASSLAHNVGSSFNNMKKWSVNASRSMANQVMDKHSWLNKHTNGAAKTMFTGLRKTYSAGHKAMRDGTKTFSDFVHGRWGKLGGDVKHTARDMMSASKSAFRTGYNTLNKLTGGWMGKMVDWFKDLPGRLASGIRNGWGKMVSAAKHLGNGLIKGIASGVNGAIGGIDWILRKIHVHQIPKWHPHYFAQGGQAKGLAVVGEQGKHELIKYPSGKMELSPNKATLYHFKEPVSILGGDKTEQLLRYIGIPKFGIGNFLGSAVDFVKGGFSKIAHGAEGFWDAITHPKQLLNTAIEHYTKLAGLNTFALSAATGTVKYVAKNALSWVKKQLDFGGAGNPGGSGVQRWKPYVKRALAMTGLPTSGSYVNAWLRQIASESGGNPRAVQHGYTDVNTLSGDLAKGLLQTISATFNAYKMKGHGNIFNGLDNMLAAMRYAKSRYGKSGMLGVIGHGHGYANGTITSTPQLAELAEDGNPEAVIPLSMSKRNRAMQLLAQVAAYFADNSSKSSSANLANNDAISALIQQNNALMTQNNNLLIALTQVVVNKPTGITPVQIYQANKTQSKLIQRQTNIAKGVLTS